MSRHQPKDSNARQLFARAFRRWLRNHRSQKTTGATFYPNMSGPRIVTCRTGRAYYVDRAGTWHRESQLDVKPDGQPRSILAMPKRHLAERRAIRSRERGTEKRAA